MNTVLLSIHFLILFEVDALVLSKDPQHDNNKNLLSHMMHGFSISDLPPNFTGRPLRWYVGKYLDAPNITGPDLAKEIIDIDIGTLGKPMNRADEKSYLITFDPFDNKLLEAKYERLPFAVTADTEGETPFYVNEQIPGCSSLNKFNPIFDSNPHLANEMWHGEHGDLHNCVPKEGERCCVHQCKHPKPRKTSVLQVKSVKLSTFIKQRNINEINYLKIDAQGSDKSILEDVLSTNVTVKRIMAECQRYDKIHPIYDAQNDCQAMVDMVHHYQPGFKVEWLVNNCLNAEYNLIFKRGDY